MAQQVSCPGCKANYRLPDSARGKSVQIKCSKCGKVFVSGAAANATGVQAAKKPAVPPTNTANAKAKVPPQQPAPRKKSAAGCIIAVTLLFVLIGMVGAGAAIGGYFAFFHQWGETVVVVQNEPKTEIDTKLTIKDKNPEPKEKTPEPKEKLPEPKEKTPEPKEKLPEPKEKTPEPKEKLPDPKEKNPEPKEKTPEPKEKLPEPKEKVPEPKEKMPDPKEKPVITLYQLKDPPTPPAEIKLDASAAQVVVTPDGKTAVVATGGFGQERRVMVVDLVSGKTIKTTPMPGLAVRSMVISPDGKVVFIGGNDDRQGLEPPQRVYIWVYSLKAGTFTGTVKGPQQEVDSMSISADGTLLACQESSFNLRGVVRVINWKTGVTVFYREKVHQNVNRGIAITPDKKYVISTGVENDGKSKVVLFDLAAKKDLHTISNFPGGVEGVAVSSDSKLMAAAVNQGNGGSVRVWDIEIGTEKLALLGKEGNRGARCVAFGPDDKTIIATFYDATTRVFDLKTGNEEGAFYSRGVNSGLLATAPDGKTVLTVNSRDARVWQLPDSLMRMTKAGAPPFAFAYLDGKAVEIRGAGVRDDDANFKTFTNATIESVRNKAVVHFIADGAPTEVHLQPNTKFFNDMGMAIAPEDAGKILRIGNQVNIKVKKEFRNPAVEVRLSKEGPAEITVQNARQTGSGFPIFIFATPGKEIRAKMTPDVRYVDHEGKAISAKEGKFFNSEDLYALKLRMEAWEEVPILVEVRLTPEKGQLPVFLKYPLGVVGAKTLKNAELKQVTIDKTTRYELVVAGEDPITFFMNNETKIWDMKGNAVNTQQFLAQKDMRVDAVIVARGKGVLLLEMKALVALAPPPPVAKKIVDHNNVSISRPAGNDKQAFLRPVKGQSILVTLDPNLKAFDKAGKAIATDRIYQAGARIDAKIEEAGPDRTLIEARLVDEPLAAGRTSFEGIEVLKGSGKVYSLKIGDKTINVLVFKETKSFDADGKPAPVEQVLTVGNRVDALIDVRANPKTVSPLLEVRASKKK
jgi:predicted Zn finger-like uncharacterized protein